VVQPIYLDYNGTTPHDPEVIAAISNHTHYANAVKTARPLVDPAILGDPAIYPSPEVIARLQSTRSLAPKQERLRTRVWARFKAGL